jgi:hypothetical protein
MSLLNQPTTRPLPLLRPLQDLRAADLLSGSFALPIRHALPRPGSGRFPVAMARKMSSFASFHGHKSYIESVGELKMSSFVSPLGAKR